MTDDNELESHQQLINELNNKLALADAYLANLNSLGVLQERIDRIEAIYKSMHEKEKHYNTLDKRIMRAVTAYDDMTQDIRDTEARLKELGQYDFKYKVLVFENVAKSNRERIVEMSDNLDKLNTQMSKISQAVSYIKKGIENESPRLAEILKNIELYPPY